MKIACGEVGRQQELVLLDQTLGGESHTAAGLTRRLIMALHSDQEFKLNKSTKRVDAIPPRQFPPRSLLCHHRCGIWRWNMRTGSWKAQATIRYLATHVGSLLSWCASHRNWSSSHSGHSEECSSAKSAQSTLPWLEALLDLPWSGLGFGFYRDQFPKRSQYTGWFF